MLLGLSCSNKIRPQSTKNKQDQRSAIQQNIGHGSSKFLEFTLIVQMDAPHQSNGLGGLGGLFIKIAQ